MDKALTEHICKIVENKKEKDSFYEHPLQHLLFVDILRPF